jgi:hypothetical protein
LAELQEVGFHRNGSKIDQFFEPTVFIPFLPLQHPCVGTIDAHISATYHLVTTVERAISHRLLLIPALPQGNRSQDAARTG